MSKQKIHATTQYFTEISDITDNVIILTNGYACSVIEVMAVNFALLSAAEQYAKISSFASLLNSLSFPIQILVKSKREDISFYLKSLETEAQKAKNEKLGNFILEYKNFVSELIKQNSILDKRFYITISFSSLELGATHAFTSRDFASSANSALLTKINTLLDQIGRINLKARVLGKEELVKLSYELFNPMQSNLDVVVSSDDIQAPTVKGKQ